MKKAVFIIPYFGKLPQYHKLWMKTASTSENVDFWIFTDDVSCISNYQNVKIHYVSFTDFLAKAQSKFDFKLGLTSPRKLCDMKPVYGYIFEEEIQSYPYWGYCDIDVVLGDLDRMIPWEKDFQKLFAHGHMTLFQNTPENNKLFMKSVDGFENYRDILAAPENRVFDESSDGLNINLIAQKENISLYFDYNIIDINPYHFLFKRTLYDYSMPYKKGRPVMIEEVGKQLFLWENGKLYRYYIKEVLIKEEMRYVHFQKRILSIQNGCIDSERFIVIPNRVIPFNEEITISVLNSMVRNRFIYPQFYRLKWNNLKKRLRARI